MSEHETRTRAGSRGQLPKLPDRGVEFGLLLLLSNGTSAVTRFRATPEFHCFPSFRGFELNKSLCFQIREIGFVFWPIKTRVIPGFCKVGRVSGAGQVCRCDTVQVWYTQLIFPFQRDEPGGHFRQSVRSSHSV